MITLASNPTCTFVLNTTNSKMPKLCRTVTRDKRRYEAVTKSQNIILSTGLQKRKFKNLTILVLRYRLSLGIKKEMSQRRGSVNTRNKRQIPFGLLRNMFLR